MNLTIDTLQSRLDVLLGEIALLRPCDECGWRKGQHRPTCAKAPREDFAGSALCPGCQRGRGDHAAWCKLYPPAQDPRVAAMRAQLDAKLAELAKVRGAAAPAKRTTTAAPAARGRFDRSLLRGTVAARDYAWALGETPDNPHSLKCLSEAEILASVGPSATKRDQAAAARLVKQAAKVHMALEDRTGFRVKVQREIERAAMVPYVPRAVTVGTPPPDREWYLRNTIWGQRVREAWDPVAESAKHAKATKGAQA